MSVMLEFPSGVLVPNDVSLAPVYNTRPGHEATNGMRRSLGQSGAQWKMQFNVFVHDQRTVRAARGFLFNMEADSQLVRIRMPDRYGLDGPFAEATKPLRRAWRNGIPFASDALYATGVGHAVPTLETTFHSGAALNDRYINATLLDDTIGGCAISINEFCYGIAGSWVEGGVNRLKISPVLRQAAAAGDVISLAPVFVGFCVTDNPGYEALTAGKHGFHTLEFVEDLTRLVEDVD